MKNVYWLAKYNTLKIKKSIDEKAWGRTTKKLYDTITEQEEEIKYYIEKSKQHNLTIKTLRNRIKDLESKNK